MIATTIMISTKVKPARLYFFIVKKFMSSRAVTFLPSHDSFPVTACDDRRMNRQKLIMPVGRPESRPRHVRERGPGRCRRLWQSVNALNTITISEKIRARHVERGTFLQV